MASIIERNDRFCVVYIIYDDDGKRHQKWETYKSMAEAKARKNEIEYNQQLGGFVVPVCRTVSDLMTEYINLYGKTTWTVSTYSSNTSMIRHYILPFLGNMKLIEVTPRVIEKYYQQILKTESVPRATDRKGKEIKRRCTPATVRKIHNILRSAFKQAEKWELVEKNPATLVTVPKSEPKKRDIWDAHTLQTALDKCEDERLRLCLNLAFSCSLRIGELLGLTWADLDISPEAVLAGKPYLQVNKELQRVSKKAMNTLEQKDILMVFPEHTSNNKTMLVLKKPKTASSVRKVFMPKAVAEMLQRWKMEQDSEKAMLGDEYQDFNLVIANPLGSPTESSRIRDAMKQLIEENDLPPIVFHSLRHSSITYKLKLNGGDIKAVQGDSGHSQATMVTDQYSHILDENRVANAQLIQEAFYEGKSVEELRSPVKTDYLAEQVKAAGIDQEALLKILSNPTMASLIYSLSKTIE